MHANTVDHEGVLAALSVTRRLFQEIREQDGGFDPIKAGRFMRLLNTLAANSTRPLPGTGVDGRDIAIAAATGLAASIPWRLWNNEVGGRDALRDISTLVRTSAGPNGASAGEVYRAIGRAWRSTQGTPDAKWMSCLTARAVLGVGVALGDSRGQQPFGETEQAMRVALFMDALAGALDENVDDKDVGFLGHAARDLLRGDDARRVARQETGKAWLALLVMAYDVNPASGDPQFVFKEELVGGQLGSFLVTEGILPPADHPAVMPLLCRHDGQPWCEQVKARMRRVAMEEDLGVVETGRRPRL